MKSFQNFNFKNPSTITLNLQLPNNLIKVI